MRDTKLYRVMVGFERGVMVRCEAVEYQGANWLVPKWLPFPGEGYAKPGRMIRLDQFQHQAIPQPADIDFRINEPIPRALFDGKLTSKLKKRYVVLDKPDARFRMGRMLN